MGKKKKKQNEEKYAAKLFFQFRVGEPEESSMRTCEIRIINFYSSSDDKAYKYANKYGKKQQFKYKNDEDDKVYFEYVGLLDIHDLGVGGDEEVFYDIKNMRTPMERKNKLIPKKSELKQFKK